MKTLKLGSSIRDGGIRTNPRNIEKVKLSQLGDHRMFGGEEEETA